MPVWMASAPKSDPEFSEKRLIQNMYFEFEPLEQLELEKWFQGLKKSTKNFSLQNKKYTEVKLHLTCGN